MRSTVAMTAVVWEDEPDPPETRSLRHAVPALISGPVRASERPHGAPSLFSGCRVTGASRRRLLPQQWWKGWGLGLRHKIAWWWRALPHGEHNHCRRRPPLLRRGGAEQAGCLRNEVGFSTGWDGAAHGLLCAGCQPRELSWRHWVARPPSLGCEAERNCNFGTK